MFSINRSTVAYWILGLCNNYGYVVMLSAAHDILTRLDKFDNQPKILNNDRKCNELSTGVILLANIVPSLIVKIVSPFLPLWMNIRLSITVITAAIGFILVGMSNTLTLTIIGVACTAFSSGIGESSLLSFTVFYKDKSIVSAWSSGTGGAGFFGSMTYAGLLAIGISPSMTLYILLIIPLSMAISFWLILENPLKNQSQEAIERKVSSPELPTKINEESFMLKINKIPSALKYAVPLFLVYYFEYVINQGLAELSILDNSFIDRKTQYRWYQVCYQIGVFISRSSIQIIQIKKLWIIAFLQGLNLIFFLFQAIYIVVNNVWIIFAIIICEGILGGFGYINTYYKIQVEEEPENREVVTGFTMIAETFGITLSGVTAIPLHNKICALPTMSLF
ncbi:hypothetical protein PGB90_007055 [Kerria lacca]